MAIICVENTVTDYAKFRAHFDKNADRRTAAGMTNPRVFRNADSGNEILVLVEVADAEKAKQALVSAPYKAAMQEAGSVGTTNIYVMG